MILFSAAWPFFLVGVLAKKYRFFFIAEELEENEQAFKKLLKKLSSKGGEIFFKQPLTTLTHSQAAAW